MLSLVERIQSEGEVGVPRRFSMGTLFVLLTLYCLLFRVLVLLGADEHWTTLVCVFFSAVTGGQMILFGGVKPRAASIVAGAVTCPAILVLLVLDELTTELSGWQPLSSGLNDLGAFSAACMSLTMVGAAVGYLVGCATAGVFYVIQKLRPGINVPQLPTIVDLSRDRRLPRWLRTVGDWLNPIQPRRPWRGALATFLVLIAFGFLVSPFLMMFSQRHIMIFATVAGICLAFWSGILQLRLWWTILLTASGAVAAMGVADALQQIVFFQDFFAREPNVLSHLVRVLGGMVGLTMAALAGWIQCCRFQYSGQRRFGWLTHGLLMVSLFGAAALAVGSIRAWSQTPTQRLFTKIKGDGGEIYWGGPGQWIWGVHLGGGSGDKEFLQLRPFLDGAVNVNLSSPNITDASVKALRGMGLQQLLLGGSAITDEAFDRVSGLSAMILYLNDAKVGDPCLEALTAIPEMRRVLARLVLDRSEIRGSGFLHLGQCSSLTSLSLRGCEIEEDHLAGLATIRRLREVAFSGCAITDDGVKTIVDSVTQLQRLSLDGTRVSDAGLVHLARAKSLRSVQLSATLVTRAGVDALRKAIPSCAVNWHDPSEQ